jgi:predicted ATPase
LWIGCGQCIEHFGAGEAYMPVLEALGRLCREPGGERLVAVLAQYAPTWLVQMPALLSAADLEALQRKVQGATRERMLREMAEAIEALTAERPLILRLEDLHWSDVSTLELLSVLARRQETARLLVIGTYRPVEMLSNRHPLRAVKQELQLHRQCEELRLGFLTEEHIAEYLTVRFSVEAWRAVPLRQLAHAIHQRTDGNPLFMVNVVDYLLAHGAEAQQVVSQQPLEERLGVVPASIQQIIEKQLARLSRAEQHVLEVASVAGADFSVAAVAAGLQATTGEVEAYCAGLARREQFVRVTGVSEWPDGTVATRYNFLHALYQEVLYERMPVGQRIDLHRGIGGRAEAAYGDRAREIAAELAMHFERGRDTRRAVQYLQQAGANAIWRSAHQEAISLLSRGLGLLKTLPDTSEHSQQELALQIALGSSLIATNGYGVPEVEHVYARARELCRQVGETPQLFPALWGLWMFHLVRGEYRIGRELGEQFLDLAQRQHDAAPLLQAHYGLGATLFLLGEFVSARAHVEQVSVLYDLQQHRSLVFFYGGVDARVDGLSYVALSGWYLGYADQALESIHTVLTLAQDLSHPFSLAFALFHAAELHYLRRDGHAAQERAAALIALSHDRGFPETLALGTILRGWALAEQGQAEEGIAQLHEGLAALRAIGTEVQRPYYLAMLVDACERGGQVGEGLSAVAEALAQVDKTGERYYEAELYRLKGELTLAQSSVQRLGSSVKTSQKLKVKSRKSQLPNSQHLTPSTQAEAEECFQKAIEVACKQQAKSLELRATMSLARLWQSQGKHHAARTTLSEIYNWFTDGFDTKDLQEAKVLLEELT